MVKTKSGLCHEHVAKCPWNKDFKGDYFSPEGYAILCRAKRACLKINDMIHELCLEDLMELVNSLDSVLKPTKSSARIKFENNEVYANGTEMMCHVRGTGKDAQLIVRTVKIEAVHENGEYDISWNKDDVYVRFDDDGLLKVRIPKDLQDAIDRYKGDNEPAQAPPADMPVALRDGDVAPAPPADMPVALRDGDVAPAARAPPHRDIPIPGVEPIRQRAPRRCGHCVRRGLMDQAIGHDIRRCPVLRAEREAEQAIEVE